MIDKFKNIFLKYKSGILYLFFGGLSTLLNIVVFFCLNTLLKMNYQVANVIAWIVVVIFAYTTNKIWVFESKTKNKSELVKETLSFVMARLITLGMEFILLYVLIEKIHILEIVSKIIINVIVIVVNYLFSKLFIFNSQKKNKKNKDLKKIIIPIIFIFIIISSMLYKYGIYENGYNIKLFTKQQIEYNNGGDLSRYLGNKPLYMFDGDTLRQAFEIDEDNPKYMHIFFDTYKIYEAFKNEFVIKIYDSNNNIIIENKINEKYIYDSKYEIDIHKLSKGKYTLEVKHLSDDNTIMLTYNWGADCNFYTNGIEEKGSIDVAILYKNTSNYLWFYLMLLTITGIFLTILFICNKYKSTKLENIFLIIAIPIYLMYLIFIPTNCGHDEEFHWNRIFEITEGGFTSEIKNDKAGYTLPKGIILNVPDVYSIRYQDILKNKPSIIDYSDKTFLSNETIAVYSPGQYLPHLAGVTLGKTITDNSLIIFYIGRIFNMVSCILILYLAIKKMPYLKKIMFLFAFIPITIEGITTLSADGLLIAVSYYLLAYILDIIENSDSISIKNYIIIFLLGTLLAFSKLVYIPLIGLLLLIPTNKFKSKKDKIIKLLIIFASLILINFIWLKIASKYLEVYTLGKSNAQISFILSNPFKYFQILIHSIENNGVELLMQTFGKNLLHYEVITNYTIIPISLIAVSLIILFNENKKDIIKKSGNIIITTIFLLVFVLIFTSIFIQWTNFNTDIIYGVQGRYFLPILPLICILLRNIIKGKCSLKEETVNKILIITCITVNYIVILELVTRFM